MRSILELVPTTDTADAAATPPPTPPTPPPPPPPTPPPPPRRPDYRALTEGCGLIDRSERGKLALNGPGAVEFLNGQVTNELAALRSGEGCYAAFLTHKGKMLGDLRILAAGELGDGALGAAARHRAGGAAGAVRHDPPLQGRL